MTLLFLLLQSGDLHFNPDNDAEGVVAAVDDDDDDDDEYGIFLSFSEDENDDHPYNDGPSSPSLKYNDYAFHKTTTAVTAVGGRQQWME
mmetsp:Transcript_4149/g.4678  ORF Transcript_4149/g.4678 Transcript_4149/m.4678 type:complete len:89 (-) Transcript_4149:61-327(-)